MAEVLPRVFSEPAADQSADSAGVVKEALQQSLADAEITRDSAPAGLDTALRILDKDPSSDQVAILFLKVGVKAWYAYFRATSRDTHVGSLAAQLPASTLRRIASDISTTVPHQSVTDRIKRTFEVARRGKSRTEMLQNILQQAESTLPQDASESPAEGARSVDTEYIQQSETSSSSADNTHLINQRPSKRVRADYEQHTAERKAQYSGACVISSGGLGQERTGLHAPLPDETNVPMLSTASLPGACSTVVKKPEYFAWPRALHLPFVFPHDICTSIVKNNGLASVELSMKDPTNCYMTLEILPTSVQLMAGDLFGVRIRFISQRRHIYFENGATVHGNGLLELRGAKTEKIDMILGFAVGKAFRESPHRVEEHLSGQSLSSAVSFTIGEKAEDSGRLTIMLNAEQSLEICHRLSGLVQ